MANITLPMAESIATLMCERVAAALAAKGFPVSTQAVRAACGLDVPPRKDVVLLNKAQEQHYEACRARLERFGVYLDQSVMGAGKTYIALKLAQALGVPLLVVAPKTALAMWERLASEYGVPILAALSYQALTGRFATPLAHPWLTRTPLTPGEPEQAYSPSAHLLQAARTGVFLVVDEAHNIKNPGNKPKAVTALMDGVRALRSRGVPAYAALVSASPMDKEPMAVQYMRALGVYPAGPLRDSHRRATGYERFVANCRKLDAATTERLRAPADADIDDLRATLFPLFLEVMVPAYASSMPDPTPPATLSNHYYEVSNPRMRTLLRRSQNIIKAATGYDGVDATLKFDGLGAFTRALAEHEHALAEVLVRDGLAWLAQHPKGKVVIFTNYNSTLGRVADEYTRLGLAPVRFVADLTASERDAAVARFQTDPTCRVFVTNVATGGVSISLHDCVGDAPRLALLMPTYRILEIYQATGRVVRQGMLSAAEVRMCYSKDYPLEPMFDALARKSAVLKVINQGANKATTRKYPGEFPKVTPSLSASIAAGGARSEAWHTLQKTKPFQVG